MQNSLQKNSTGLLGIISDMSIGEFLLNWLFYRIKKFEEGANEFIRSYTFIDFRNKNSQINTIYNEDQKKFVQNIIDSLHLIKDIYRTTYQN